MNEIVSASINTLKKSKNLLETLTDEQLSDHSVSPYYSCIGSHIRHILDFYDCILDGIPKNHIDLSDRKRDLKMHEDCAYSIENIERVIINLNSLKSLNAKTNILVTDDLGMGILNIEYTLGAIMAQANSHAIHHYAIINYIMDRLEIVVKDETFGFNPTSPQTNVNLN